MGFATEFLKKWAGTLIGRILIAFVLGGAATVADMYGYVDVSSMLKSTFSEVQASVEQPAE